MRPASKADLIKRKLRQARTLHETAVEMDAVAQGLFREAHRLVDEIDALRHDRPIPLIPFVLPQFGER